MRFSGKCVWLLVCILALAGAPRAAAGGQAKSHAPSPERASDAFPPLEAWRAAVVSGSAEAIAKFYSTNPPAKAVVNGQPSSNVNEEAEFWAGLKSAGMREFNPKILEMVSPSSAVRELVLRVEGTLHAPTAAPGAPATGQNVVAGMQMVWARQPAGWKIVEVQRSAFNLNAVRTLPQPSRPNVNLYPPPADAERELQEALAAAKRTHKRVIVVFGANWCYDCHVLDTTFRSKAFAPLVQANYEVVHVNIGDEGKDNAALAARLGVGLAKGIPSLAVLEPGGAVVYAQKNGEFESSVKIGPADVRAFLEKWKPAGSR